MRLRFIGTVAVKEFGGYFRTPIAYIVGVLFLAAQGFLFSGVVRGLADHHATAPYESVLSQHFGGTLLYWVVVIGAVALIAMRTVAEERRQGTWELLMTSQLDESSVVVGKWLAAVWFWTLLWLPTVSYVVILARFMPGEAQLDVGPIVAAYLGVIVSGAGFLAVGLACSASAPNQIIACAVCFASLFGLLAIGQVGEFHSDTGSSRGLLAAVARMFDLRGHMSDFASGSIELGTVVFYVSMVVVGLTWACVGATLGRATARRLWRRVLACTLITVAAGSVVVIGANHPTRWDVSRAGLNSLDPRTRAVLARVAEPITVVAVRPESDEFVHELRQVRRVLAMFARYQPLVHVTHTDPARSPHSVSHLAAEFAINPEDIAVGGLVVFQRGARRRVVDLVDIAGFDYDELGVRTLSSFRAEEAFATAIHQLNPADPKTICFTTKHGELERVASVRENVSSLRERLLREGMTVRSAELDGLAGCDALFIIGLQIPIAPSAALHVRDYLSKGGSLLLAVQARPLAPSGLELILAEYGISTPPAIAVDPTANIGRPLTWMTSEGYGAHPIVAGFRRGRVTVWQRPRAVVRASEIADVTSEVLVSTSAAGWGETDIAGLDSAGTPAVQGTQDLEGPVSVAVAARASNGARIVVLGSTATLSSQLVDHGSNRAFGVALSLWLLGHNSGVSIAQRRPQAVRLVMSTAQVRRVTVLCIAVIPGLVCVLGGILMVMRRRRG